MYSKKGVVYKLHAGRFISRTPGEFINWGRFIKFKGPLCGDPTERAESLILNFWPARQFISPTPGTVTCLLQARGLQDQEKIQYIKYLHCQVISRPQKIHVFLKPRPADRVWKKTLTVSSGRHSLDIV